MSQPPVEDTRPVPKYPEVEVQLTGQDGNGFFIISRVRMALRGHGVSRQEQEDFFNEAMAGDYDHLLSTCMKWVTVL